MTTDSKWVMCRAFAAVATALSFLAILLILYSRFEFNKVETTVLTSTKLVYRDFDGTETFSYISFNVEVDDHNITIHDQVSGGYFPVNKRIEVCVARFSGYYVDAAINCFFGWMLIPTITITLTSMLLIFMAAAMIFEHHSKQKDVTQLELTLQN